MTDPITIIGTAGAVANIVELLNSTISSLRRIRAQWKDADLVASSLVAQLTALKAALGRIQDWMQSENEDPHHQLIMDLDLSLDSCQALVKRIDLELSGIRLKETSRLDKTSKVKLIFGGQSIEVVQKMLERQTNALSLLLTACNCSNISQQKAILDRSSTRKTMKRIKDDSSSLYVNRDAASLLSCCTDRLSKLSMVFAFDKELLRTDIYQRILRGSLKEMIRQKQADVRLSKRNAKVRLIHQQERRILLAGEWQSKQAVFADALDSYEPISLEERTKWRKKVKKLFVARLQTVIEAVTDAANVESQQIDLDCARDLLIELTRNDIDHPMYDLHLLVAEDLAEAVERFLESDPVQAFLRFAPAVLGKTDTHYFPPVSLRNAMNPDYCPSHVDTLAIRKTNRIDKRCLKIRQVDYVFIDAVGNGSWDNPTYMSLPERFLIQFQPLLAMIFVVDLACYDSLFQTSDSASNDMKMVLYQFDHLVNSSSVKDSGIILLFVGWEPFTSKLRSSPLSNHFPDFEGGHNSSLAFDYILSRFTTLNRQQMRGVYPHVCNIGDGTTLSFITRQLQELDNDKWYKESPV